MADLELKPCPFCGEQPKVSTRQDEDLSTHDIVTWTAVECDNCDVGFDWPEGVKPDAITQWNTRPST